MQSASYWGCVTILADLFPSISAEAAPSTTCAAVIAQRSARSVAVPNECFPSLPVAVIFTV